jgi:hypothetical protein
MIRRCGSPAGVVLHEETDDDNGSRPAEHHEAGKVSAADRPGTPVNSVVVCSCSTRSASPPRGTVSTEAVLADEAIPRLDHPRSRPMLESPVWSPCSITEGRKGPLPLGLLA